MRGPGLSTGSHMPSAHLVNPIGLTLGVISNDRERVRPSALPRPRILCYAPVTTQGEIS